MKTQLVRCIFLSDPHGIRFLLGFAEILWGVTLIFPGSTFDRPTYSVMREFLSEDLWAALFLIVGCMQWGILYTQNYHSRYAVIFAAFNTVFWLFLVCAMYAAVSPIPAAISGETALAVGAAWVFLRTGGQS